MKYTVFFDQVNRTNFQVTASSEEVAEKKAAKLYKKELYIPLAYVGEGWIVDSDGEDK